MVRSVSRGARGLTAGVMLLVVAGGLGLAVSIFNYFWPGNGIHGSTGALLVVGSTALMVVAAVVIAADAFGRRWLDVLLAALILLDILGTGLAAYFLTAWILLGLMVVALFAWLWRALGDGRPTANAATSEAKQ